MDSSVVSEEVKQTTEDVEKLQEVESIFHNINSYQMNHGINETPASNQTASSLAAPVVQNQTVVAQEKVEIDRIFKKMDDFKAAYTFDVASSSAAKAIQAAESEVKIANITNSTEVHAQQAPAPEIKAIIKVDKPQSPPPSLS